MTKIEIKNYTISINVILKSYNTTYKTLSVLEDTAIVREITGAQRGKVYMFDDYISLFKD